jgi:ParB/RepB/Spo0J family partition protein
MNDSELTQASDAVSELMQEVCTASESGSSVAEPKGKGKGKKATLPAGLTFSKEFQVSAVDLVSTPDRPEEEESREELYRSIKALGVLVPLIVRAKGDKWEIIDGRRRFAAGLRANITTFNCKAIEGASDLAIDRLVSLVANRIRLDETPWSQAKKLQAIKEEGWSFAQIVASTGFSKSTVSDLLFATSKQMTEEDQKRLDRGDNLFKVVRARKEALKRKDEREANETPKADELPEAPGAGEISEASAEPTGNSARSPAQREHEYDRFSHHATGLTIAIKGKSKRKPARRNVIAALRDILQAFVTAFEDGGDAS